MHVRLRAFCGGGVGIGEKQRVDSDSVYRASWRSTKLLYASSRSSSTLLMSLMNDKNSVLLNSVISVFQPHKPIEAQNELEVGKTHRGRRTPRFIRVPEW